MKSYEDMSREELIEELKDAYDENEKFRILLECSPEAILFETEDGEIIDCNKSATELFGYIRKELLKQTAFSLASEDIASKLPELLKDERKSGGINVRNMCRKKNGDSFPAEIFTKLIEINGKIHRFAVIHDLTKFQDSNDNSMLSEEKQIEPQADTNKYKILVIDDEKNICEILSVFLSNEGFEVFIAQSGKEGIDYFKRYSCDIVITDMNMPEISGLEIARKVKEKSPGTSIIMLTGYDIILDKMNKEKKLLDRILSKPINFPGLLQQINDIIKTKAKNT